MGGCWKVVVDILLFFFLAEKKIQEEEERNLHAPELFCTLYHYKVREPKPGSWCETAPNQNCEGAGSQEHLRLGPRFNREALIYCSAP